LDRGRGIGGNHQPANFTLDTLAELSAALGIKRHVRMLPGTEHMIFGRGLTVTTKMEPTIGFPKSETKHAAKKFKSSTKK